ncbi:hypothetical protein IC575_030333 [Cucumis melo]
MIEGTESSPFHVGPKDSFIPRVPEDRRRLKEFESSVRSLKAKDSEIHIHIPLRTVRRTDLDPLECSGGYSITRLNQ